MTKFTCVHHWLIETPEGPLSHAVCCKCGAETDMANYDERMTEGWLTGTPGRKERAATQSNTPEAHKKRRATMRRHRRRNGTGRV